ncbi:MAG: hypothetical protein KGD64_08730 [Candidatus Heimdallarchaeota archaeon]|nr:hypothetical protein [Candidatus Heimdallarchaeota archaeon]
MKLEKVLEFVNELKKIENVEAHSEFSYAAMKNSILGKQELEIFKKVSLDVIDGGEEYRKDRIEVIGKYVERDELQNIKSEKSPVDGRSHFVFIGDNKIFFIKAMEEVEKKHADYIKKIKSKREEIDKILEQTSSVEFMKVPLEYFPNKITPKQMEVLKVMLVEEEK